MTQTITKHLNLKSKTTDPALEPLESLCFQIKNGSNTKKSFKQLEKLVEQVINNRAPFQAWEASYILSNMINPSTSKDIIDTTGELQQRLFYEADVYLVQDVAVKRYNDPIGKKVTRAKELRSLLASAKKNEDIGSEVLFETLLEGSLF